MLKNYVEILMNLFGVDSGTSMEEIKKIGGYALSAINYIKMKRFKSRLDIYNIQIKCIGDKVNNLDDEELKLFIQNTFFPYVLDDLIEENQDKKIEFILNGFEFIVDEKVIDKGFAIASFDVLRDLRVDDIIRLLKYTDEYKTNFAWKVEEDSFKNMVGRWTGEEVEKFKKEAIYSKQIDNKLEYNNLISNNRDDMVTRIFRAIRMNNRTGGNFESQESKIRNENKSANEYKLTEFGEKFIDMFDLRIADNNYFEK